uniref:FHOD1 N-terminal GTPase-binding domain-containing protein n=1 Tax=Strigops habroptila TaxID=2489341 RepID=A0A672TGL3_STRHB
MSKPHRHPRAPRNIPRSSRAAAGGRAEPRAAGTGGGVVTEGYLEDSYPFGCDRFPEPWRAPVYAVAEALALGAQLPALHQLLGLEPCCLHPQLEVSPSGRYLDFDLSLLEQKDDLEGFYEEVR